MRTGPYLDDFNAVFRWYWLIKQKLMWYFEKKVKTCETEWKLQVKTGRRVYRCIQKCSGFSIWSYRHTSFVHADSEWPFAAESAVLFAFKAINCCWGDKVRLGEFVAQHSAQWTLKWDFWVQVEELYLHPSTERGTFICSFLPSF